MPRVNQRSTVFAFKCRMDSMLTRADLNALLTYTVKQLFFTVEDGVHLVCMRLTRAVSRVRFVNALRALELKPRIGFRLPEGARNWTTTLLMGDELRGGEGLEIIQVLRTHMTINNPSYVEQLDEGGGSHLTHMVRDAMRPSRAPAPLHRSESEVTIPINDEEEAQDPVAVEEAQEPRAIVFMPPVLINGRPNPIESVMGMARAITSVLVNFLHLREGFSLQHLTEIIPGRINTIMETVSAIRTELERRV